ncbi:54S ribosomal protein img2, mitochondrial [Coemansia guatemalensis]|uniref:Large ribosomal subunit protein mL49 n=1 Tax=Coemansia guatemalensis TaxID=2761395 RepID=A0A9W8HXG7_9FUNG|nr:54S ribosomal protein img2, mitochondrial [Coemansia guatemalensis]
MLGIFSPNLALVRSTPRSILRAFQSTLAATPAEPETNRTAQSVTYPYYVRRTRFQSLPVYIDVRNGRTRKLTILRRIDGDLGALRADISKALDEESVVLKAISRQLVIKGDRSTELRKWLTEKGF